MNSKKYKPLIFLGSQESKVPSMAPSFQHEILTLRILRQTALAGEHDDYLHRFFDTCIAAFEYSHCETSIYCLY